MWVKDDGSPSAPAYSLTWSSIPSTQIGLAFVVCPLLDQLLGQGRAMCPLAEMWDCGSILCGIRVWEGRSINKIKPVAERKGGGYGGNIRYFILDSI